MPFIRKTGSQRAQHPVDARTLFIGRKGELLFFVQNILKPEEPTHNIISISGHGGVGKSTLLTRFIAETNTPNFRDYCLTALVDERQKSVVSIMQKFADQLRLGGEFKKVLHRYEEAVLKLKADQENGTLQDAALSGVPNFAGAAVEGVPIIGPMLREGVKATAQYLVARYYTNLARGDEERLLDPVADLTTAFVEELNRFVDTTMLFGSRPARERRVILFFDTFEQLADLAVPWLLEYFLPASISSNVILVVAGRTPIEYSTSDPKPWLPYYDSEMIYSISLNSFTQDETSDYLAERGVTDPDRMHMIWQLSRGLPLYLSLLTSNPRSEVDPTKDVVVNFLRWIPEQDQIKRRLVLDAALFSRPFTQDDLEAFKYVSENERSALYDWLIGLPFVLSQEGQYRYHKVVQELFSRHLYQRSKKEYYATRRAVANYYQQVIEELQQQGDKESVDTDESLELVLALTYQLLLLPDEASHTKALEYALRADRVVKHREELVKMLRELSKEQPTALVTSSARRAISRACVDTFGGLFLDIPIWLSRALQEAATLIAAAVPAQSTNEGIMLLRKVTAHASGEPDLASEILAELHLTLQELLEEAIDANQREVQEERIACLKAALPVYTLVRYPRNYAHVQHKLGVVYKQRQGGEQQRNLADAAKYFINALQVYTRDAFPQNYAMNQYNLGNVHMTLHTLQTNREHPEHLQEAISCFLNALGVYTLDRFPFEYAETQRCLGMAYADWMEDGRYTHIATAIIFLNRALDVFTLKEYPENYAAIHYFLGILHKERMEHKQKEALEEAIASCQHALQVYTLARFPVEYAKTNNALGELYMKRVAGTREANVEQAITCHNRALQVFTYEAYPLDYAETQNLLGNAYQERIAGTRITNLEEAIAYYQRALEIFTSLGNSGGYAKVLNNLGNVYRDRIVGVHQENQEQAIMYFHRALEVYTYAQFPEDFALTQSNLGNAYVDRIEGERYGNLEEAIRCFHRALQVYTLKRFPKGYATVQHNLGNAYRERLEGMRRDNIEEAINCYHRALQVFTIEDFPLKYGQTQNQLGIAYRERIEGERQDNIEEAINCYHSALQVFTLEAFPLDYARAQSNLGNAYKERIVGI